MLRVARRGGLPHLATYGTEKRSPKTQPDRLPTTKAPLPRERFSALAELRRFRPQCNRPRTGHNRRRKPVSEIELCRHRFDGALPIRPVLVVLSLAQQHK